MYPQRLWVALQSAAQRYKTWQPLLHQGRWRCCDRREPLMAVAISLVQPGSQWKLRWPQHRQTVYLVHLYLSGADTFSAIFVVSIFRIAGYLPKYLHFYQNFWLGSSNRFRVWFFPTSVMKGKLLESESSLTASMRLEMHRHQTLWTLVLKRLYCKWIMIGFHPPRWLQTFSAGCECDLLTVA